MRWRILAVGKPSLSYARQGAEEYLGRLQHYTDVEFVPVKDGSPAEVERRLLRQSERSCRIAMDERGRAWTTSDFRQKIDDFENSGIRQVSCLIGGANGHSDAIRQSCDHVVQLSALTMQHELALVVLLEQIYRAYTIKRGEPYHR